MTAPPSRAASPPARAPSTAASAPVPSRKQTGAPASTTSMATFPGAKEGSKWRWQHGRRRVRVPKVKVPRVKAKGKVEGKLEVGGPKKKGLRVPSQVVKGVEVTIRGGRDLVREGRRRFARAAQEGEKKVKSVTKEGGRQMKRAWGGVKKSVPKSLRKEMK
ncbi:hypothetical protein V499_05753 [Pseudogymnoascus sp. VKM F-103]|nr:hypothetical protein V499_05753 [Pseudogymnoascus sp. VKM F-103]